MSMSLGGSAASISNMSPPPILKLTSRGPKSGAQASGQPPALIGNLLAGNFGDFSAKNGLINMQNRDIAMNTDQLGQKSGVAKLDEELSRGLDFKDEGGAMVA